MNTVHGNRKTDNPLICNYCGIMFKRKYLSGGRLEDLTSFMKRKFCSRKCQSNAKIKILVSKNQYRWRARKSKKKSCELCGSLKFIQVHHKDGNVKNNSLQNLQTLCASCHNTHHWKSRKENGK